MFSTLIRWATSIGMPSVVYTNRKMLTRQTMANMSKFGIDFGVRAASLKKYQDFDKPVQISSIQTEWERVFKQKRWNLHSGLVLVDEAHLQASGNSEVILRSHLEKGDKIVLVTATPVGLSHLSPKLIVAGTNSQLRACGSHVPAIIKCPFEFDRSRIKREKTGEFKIGDVMREMWSQSVIAPIYESWKQYNPDSRQTIGFAPDVASSLGMAEYYMHLGVPSAHIDAKMVYVDGKQYNGDPEGKLRDEVLERFTKGDIKVLWNRWVMREGIDLPNTYHLIMATPVGTLKDWVQMCGRVVRKSEQTPDHVLITDHGGSVWDHGSPNRNIDWHEYYNLTDEQIFEKQKQEKEFKENKPENEQPIICPFCHTTRRTGQYCPDPPLGCGQPSPRRGRVILQKSGKLIDYKETTKKGKKENHSSQAQKAWDSLFWGAKKSNKSKPQTFRQLIKVFEKKYGYRPEGMLRTPKNDLDWDRRVRDVEARDIRWR